MSTGDLSSLVGPESRLAQAMSSTTIYSLFGIIKREADWRAGEIGGLVVDRTTARKRTRDRAGTSSLIVIDMNYTWIKILGWKLSAYGNDVP